MAIVSMVMALAIAGLTLGAILWSVAWPERRLWPPQAFGLLQSFIAWGGTLVFFVSVAALGILGWGGAAVPDWLRYGIGSILFLVGNVGVWSEVISFGSSQTMGAEGQLKTDGLYHFSRNPQYVADIAILIGWGLLSASVLALPAIFAGIAVFAAFPFAEERWLEERYGAVYLLYCREVRRFF